MGSIEEVFEDIKDSIGDKGFLFLLGGVALLFIFQLLKSGNSSNSDTSQVVLTASYPDAVTNANVIIDTLQNSIDYSELEMKEYLSQKSTETHSKLDDMSSSMNEGLGELGTFIQDTGSSLEDFLADNFEATNDYINTGLDSQKDLLNSLNQNMNDNFDSMQGYIGNGFSSLQSTINSSSSATNSLINDLKNQNLQSANQIIDSLKENATKTVANSSYFAKTGYTGNSIVDGLKAIGEYEASSYANRKKIAKANGIKNYTGTSKQNTKLLNKLKKGVLLRY